MTQSDIDKLEAAWEVKTGFLARLRDCDFNQTLYAEFLQTLLGISLTAEEVLSRRAVSLLWFIPLFMEWQTERVISSIAAEDYALRRTAIENELERILGLP